MKTMMEKLTYNRWLRSLVLFIFILTIAACDGADNGSDSAYEYEESSSLGFNIVWHNDEDMRRASEIPDSCDDISTVKAILYQNNDAKITEEWPCDQGQGIIQDVPAEQEFVLVVQGLGEEDRIMYYGKEEHVSVGKGQKNTVEVDAYYVGGLELQLIPEGDQEPQDSTGVEIGKNIVIKVNAATDSTQDLPIPTWTSDSQFINDNGEYNEKKSIFTCPTEIDEDGLEVGKTYTITFAATIKDYSVFKSIEIVISPEGNKVPEIVEHDDMTRYIGDNIEIKVAAKDNETADKDLTFSCDYGEITNAYATFNNATRTFIWPTNSSEDIDKTYNIKFTVYDDGEPPLSDSFTMKITLKVNQPPYFTLPDQDLFTVTQGREVSFSVKAKDPENLPLKISYLDEGRLQNAEYDENTNVFSWPVPSNLNQGDYSAKFTATDKYDNTTERTITIRVLKDQAPVVNITVPVEDPITYTGGNETFTATITDDVSVNKVKIYVIDSEGKQSNKYDLTKTGDDQWTRVANLIPFISIGENKIIIEATDSAGNVSTDSVVVIFPDKTKPVVEITDPSGTTYTTDTSKIHIIGKVSDDYTVPKTVEITFTRRDDVAIKPLTVPVNNGVWETDVTLPEGTTKITVTAIDSANNSGTASLTVTYTLPDRTPPVVNITSPASTEIIDGTYNTSETSITIAGTAVDERNSISQVSISVDGESTPAEIESDKKVSWSTSIYVEDVSTEKNYTISVTATDEAGNTSTPISFTIHYTPESEPVVVPIDDGGLDTGR